MGSLIMSILFLTLLISIPVSQLYTFLQHHWKGIPRRVVVALMLLILLAFLAVLMEPVAM